MHRLQRETEALDATLAARAAAGPAALEEQEGISLSVDDDDVDAVVLDNFGCAGKDGRTKHSNLEAEIQIVSKSLEFVPQVHPAV